MLPITVPETEVYDELNGRFIHVKEQTLQLEHSLVSLSKWESKYCKSFNETKEKTAEENLDYIRFMTLNPNVDPNVYRCLTNENISTINNYIKAPMTATRIPKNSNGKINREPLTAELIYYWMIALNIPFECQKWHINRLLTLIEVCNIKQQPAKKMSKREIMSRNAALNEARRRQFNTKG